MLAGDSKGHSFDATVIRSLMSAKLPVQQVILEDLNHVAEKYRALPHVLSKMPDCSVGDNASALLQHTISNLDIALKENPSFRGLELVRCVLRLILKSASSRSMPRSLFDIDVRQRKRRKRHVSGGLVIGRQPRRLSRLDSRCRLMHP